MKYLLGKKLGMTQHISPEGMVTPVTIIEAGPCVITQIKEFKNGKKSYQIGFGEAKKLNKPQSGHLRDKKLKNLREFPFSDDQKDGVEVGQTIDLSIFSKDLKVDIVGISKGKGFQGTTKRHNFKIGPKTHGSKSHRKPGSIGSRYPQRVIKGRQLPGRMGNDRVTVKKLTIVDIEADKNLLLVKGGIPGQNGRLIIVRQS